ncbi:unnamed protein product [Blepharisma stoltei]|uniref:Uncharacterized protein n=1 Tax=Blepharisma stoltei TaxID=1481888 RepID=A0AAU9JUZ1_9CILI|nr:unnamed protein product [Blepharisma stoltei]
MMFRNILRFYHKNTPKSQHLYDDPAPKVFQLICQLFGQERRPPAHILAFEALEHMNSDYMKQTFPSMTSEYSIHKNITLMHFSMIVQRFEYEETRESINEAAKFYLLCEKYIFERYLDLVENLIDVPVAEFEAELVEMLVKDFESIDRSIACYGYKKPFIVLEEIPGYNIQGVIINEIFENRIKKNDSQVSKLYEYFEEHKKYLESLTYHQFINEKINWGLFKD